MLETKHTFCRICEASCGLEASLENGKIVDIKPNAEHIGTDGFACMKGLNQHKMYDSPDRLTSPLKRVGDSFVPISWQQANAEIGEKVKALRKVSPQSIAMYVGTAAGFSILHPIFAEGFMQGIGSHNIFSSATQDCANRFASANEMYGFPFHQPFPDLEHIECLLIVGTNPVVSKWTFLQVAHPVKRLKEVKARGGEVIVVDPRFTETAKVANQHLFIKPNADVFFFLSFLHEVFLQGGVKAEIVAEHMTGLAEVEALAACWPAEKTQSVTGIEPQDLKALVAKFIHAKGAGIVTGTGIGMGKYGTTAHWIAEVINAITGNLDRIGGMLVGEGIFNFAEFAKKQGLFSREARSRIGGFQQLNGGFPGAILADEILTPGTEQVKSLFVTGGNPLLTMANSERLQEAFKALDLLVVTDIYLNETASLAHYVLPATSPLQRDDLPFVFPLFLGMQSKPYISATEAIVAPEGLQRDEANIYFDLAAASGVGLFDSKILQFLLRAMRGFNRIRHWDRKRGLPIPFLLNALLKINKQKSFKQLVAMPNGDAKAQVKAGTFLSQRPTTDDKKVHLAPTLLTAMVAGLDDAFSALSTSATGFKMISKRAHSTHNSWTQNIAELTNGKMGQSNYLYMHPDDATKLGLEAGAAADIESKAGRIRLPVMYLSELMPGTVAVPHGWGHQQARGLSVASQIKGANVNILASDGPDEIEAVSGMVHLSGIDVKISPSVEAVNTQSWSGC